MKLKSNKGPQKVDVCSGFTAFLNNSFLTFTSFAFRMQGSSNGTFLNNQRIEPRRYVELKEKDVLKFGYSSREYVLLHDQSEGAVDSDWLN